MKAKSETPALYAVTHCGDDATIAQAVAILASRMRKAGAAMSAPACVRDYLRLRMAELQHEVFGILWLDAQNRLIADDQLFRGTLTQTSVYPREVVKASLAANSAACILYHNHPSGIAEQSLADVQITSALKSALALVDCRVLDHMIVGGLDVMSFAERGLL